MLSRTLLLIFFCVGNVMDLCMCCDQSQNRHIKTIEKILMHNNIFTFPKGFYLKAIIIFTPLLAYCLSVSSRNNKSSLMLTLSQIGP